MSFVELINRGVSHNFVVSFYLLKRQLSRNQKPDVKHKYFHQILYQDSECLILEAVFLMQNTWFSRLPLKLRNSHLLLSLYWVRHFQLKYSKYHL